MGATAAGDRNPPGTRRASSKESGGWRTPGRPEAGARQPCGSLVTLTVQEPRLLGGGCHTCRPRAGQDTLTRSPAEVKLTGKGSFPRGHGGPCPEGK